MLDGFSYLLGKKSGGSSDSSVGWTNQNIDNREAVFKSLPEEILVDMNTMIWGYVKCMSSLCHLVKVTSEEGVNYTGGITLHVYDTDSYMCYTVVGRLTVTVMTDGAIPEVVDVSVSGYEAHNTDDVGSCRDFANSYELENLNIIAYKGIPVEIPTYTVTINNVSDPGSYNEDLVRYSIDGGNNWLWVKEPTIVLKDVAQIIFVDDCEFGGYIRDEDGNDIANTSGYAVTYTPTKDIRLELYISW